MIYKDQKNLTKKEINKLQRKGVRPKSRKSTKKQTDRMRSNSAIINRLLKEVQ